MAPDDAEIRPLTVDDDLAAFGRIVLASYTALPDAPHEPEYGLELVDVRARVEAATVFGAFDGDRPLGCVTFVRDLTSPYAEDLEPGESSFRMLAVDAAAQGRGLGERLVERCLDEARSAGSEAVFIHSGTWMPTAHRLYGRLGFVRQPHRDWTFDDPPFTLLGFRMHLAGCPGCGFEYERVDPAEVPRRIAAAAHAMADELLAHVGVAGARPAPDRWSSVEYAAHLRDVLLVMRDRIVIGLVEDDPGFAPLYKDERVELGLYAADSPADLAVELAAAAAMFTRLHEAVPAGARDRPVRYGFPDPMARTVGWMALHATHEAEHHLLDVRTNHALLA